ncbi:exosortase/archaeosortase family protein [Kineococcus sp. SYSU DK005]|uniref:exosortase/archaeosortase family protein n=1 Tax=Kineococcus sp. SYSU DK005 TaxID=3383126 RepID=UPI003D7CAEAA
MSAPDAAGGPAGTGVPAGGGPAGTGDLLAVPLVEAPGDGTPSDVLQARLLDELVEAASPDVGLVRPVLGAGTAAVVLSMFVMASDVRHAEAGLSAVLARTLGLHDVYRAGYAVMFSVEGVRTGYEITLGCTVAFLLVPFFAATSVLLTIRRVPVQRALSSLACAVGLIVTFNQLRLVAIALSMDHFGPALGYSLSHVLLGTLISTTGVVLAGTAFLAVLLRGTFTRAGAHHG